MNLNDLKKFRNAVNEKFYDCVRAIYREKEFTNLDMSEMTTIDLKNSKAVHLTTMFDIEVSENDLNSLDYLKEFKTVTINYLKRCSELSYKDYEFKFHVYENMCKGCNLDCDITESSYSDLIKEAIKEYDLVKKDSEDTDHKLKSYKEKKHFADSTACVGCSDSCYNCEKLSPKVNDTICSILTKLFDMSEDKKVSQETDKIEKECGEEDEEEDENCSDTEIAELKEFFNALRESVTILDAKTSEMTNKDDINTEYVDLVMEIADILQEFKERLLLNRNSDKFNSLEEKINSKK